MTREIMNDSTTTGTASVTVSVTTDATGTVTITCTPPTVHVGAYNTLISFNLVGAGFKFPPSNAIVMDGSFPDFPYPSWTNSNTLATLLDKCNTIDSFKYTVYVINTATNVQYNLDPIINNGDASCKP